MSIALQSNNDSENEEMQEDVHENTNEKFWQNPFYRQLFVCLGPMTLIFSSGVAMGTATVMIPQLKKINTTYTIHIDEEMESLLYSVIPYAAMPSTATLPFVTQSKGYKLPYLAICLPIIIGFLLQYFATTTMDLLIGAVLQGLTLGGNGAIGVIIISEIADPKYRGPFLILKSASYFWGVWLANAIGTFFSWRIIPMVGIFPAVFTIIVYALCPESPYWLASHGKIEECKKSFRWLRGREAHAEHELALLLTTKSEANNKRHNSTLKIVRATITKRQFCMPIFLNIAIFLLYHACGKYVFLTYVLVIIKNITANDSLAYCTMLILDGISVVGMYIGSYVGMKIGRRPMLISTSACTILFLYLFSLYLYLVQFKLFSNNNAVSLSILILYTLSVSWGPMVLCTSIFTEITPMRYKPFISSVVLTLNYMLQSLFLHLAPFLFKSLGVNGSCALYATLALFTLLILCKYLPETRNRTLEDIALYFKPQKYDFVNNEESQSNLICEKMTNKVRE